MTCVVRNGEFYVKSFIKHYLRAGFKHIVFLDNGSTDHTIPIAREHSDVSIYQSWLPIEANQALFKKYLGEHCGQGGWCLDADIDEFFDFPSSDVLTLQAFLDYLNRGGYTAVITQLLDMFSNKPLADLQEDQHEELEAAYQYYDITKVKRVAYGASALAARFGGANKLANARTELCWGGIRKTLWGNDCLLTKHSLFRPGKPLDLFPHVHFVNNASVADVSCVMRHYKLTSNALQTALQNKENFVTNGGSYQAFIEFLEKNSSGTIEQLTASKFQNADELVEQGLLFSSRKYRAFVTAKAEYAAHTRSISSPQLRQPTEANIG